MPNKSEFQGAENLDLSKYEDLVNEFIASCATDFRYAEEMALRGSQVERRRETVRERWRKKREES